MRSSSVAPQVVEKWAAAKPGTSHEGLTPKQEIKAIREAMKQDDWPFFVSSSVGSRFRPSRGKGGIRAVCVICARLSPVEQSVEWGQEGMNYFGQVRADGL